VAVLSTVEDYVREARVLLQDLLVPYRYSDDELISALNMGLEQMHKLRRDLFLKYDATPYYPTLAATEVDIDPGYRRPLLFFMVGHSQLRDEEETTDARASAFLNAFAAQLSAPGA
jgi:hypothetical protein